MGADDLVVMERDAATWLRWAGLGLADVVHERGQPEREVGFARRFEGHRLLEDGQRVLVHVLVAMVLVDLQPEPRQLGQHVIGEAGVHEQR